MALTFVQYTGDGLSNSFSVPFPYLDQAHVIGRVNGEEVPISFTSDTLVQFASVPPNGALIELRRQTPNEIRMVDFNDGSVLTEYDLDLNAIQTFYIVQEAVDLAGGTLLVNSDGSYSANGRRISSVGAPKTDSDVVTRGYFNGEFLPQMESLLLSTTSAKDTAAAKASEATTSASNASASASTATTKAQEASNSAATASASATTATEKAAAASQSASTATTKAQEAADSATTATAKASEAVASASAAAGHAASASTSASNAATYLTTVQAGANTATTKAQEATDAATAANLSKDNAANSATLAANHAATAGTHATNAANSASTATTKAQEAQASATSAAESLAQLNTQAQDAAESAADAAQSATNAAASASTASSSATTAVNTLNAAGLPSNPVGSRYLRRNDANTAYELRSPYNVIDDIGAMPVTGGTFTGTVRFDGTAFFPTNAYFEADAEFTGPTTFKANISIPNADGLLFKMSGATATTNTKITPGIIWLSHPSEPSLVFQDSETNKAYIQWLTNYLKLGVAGKHSQINLRDNNSIDFHYSNDWNLKLSLQDDGNMVIGTGGTVLWTAGVYISDPKFKDNIKPLENCLETIQKINSVTFTWNDKLENLAGKDDFGVIATEVKEAFPMLVNTSPNGDLSVQYDKIAVLLLGAVKELTARVEKLESELALERGMGVK